ncbi:alpha/beta fold hydrolase [Winogradskyella sp. DF17]|uniref:Alpha/beta fold hydrolase n=1 Tax=Winogradskyella pelagia TaxID=2819984 RepID=A0ABS3T5K5_9FLAO|nr:alpha/beta fold hydrolase [Winogradskyella sp. DF17]MBO3117010.1 alpha/beta fold hydrolase [Winogradskyella sp. DF17]
MSFTVRKNPRKKLKYTLFALFGIYIMIGASLYLLQEKIMFLPTELAQDYEYQFNYPFEEVFLKPEKNALINALHFKAKAPKGVILYFHGNAGNLSRWGTVTEYFVGLNYDVFVIDYRTYGKSKGKLSEEALYSDAQYSYNYLKEYYSENEIIIYGRSLGTGIASYLAQNNTPKKLFLETPYYSIADVAKHRFPLLPVSSLLKYKIPSYEYLKRVNCPVIILHGTADKVVPYSSGKKLTQIGVQDILFISIEGGGHNNLIEFETYHIGVETHLK